MLEGTLTTRALHNEANAANANKRRLQNPRMSRATTELSTCQRWKDRS